MGELSMTRPPASNNARSTSARWARAAASAPTSNPRHVPTPTTGRGMPDEGMGLVSIVDLPSVNAVATGVPPAIAAADTRRNWARVSIMADAIMARQGAFDRSTIGCDMPSDCRRQVRRGDARRRPTCPP